MSDEVELHWFRRFMLAILGLGFFGAGVSFFIMWAVTGHWIIGWFVFGATMLTVVGAYILWEDVARPLLRRR